MKTIKFCSCLSNEIERFIELRRLSGTDYSSQARLLMYFDHFLSEKYPNELTATRHIVEDYMQSISHLRPRVQFNRFCVVRQICKYIAQTNPCCYVPEFMKCITSSKVFHPYIFSKQEIKSLLLASSTLLPIGSLRPHTYQALFGLLYTTGIRIGEAFSLTIKDFQEEHELLYIAEGKFRKARWIPLHPSTSQSLSQYIKRRIQLGTKEPDSPLFINLRARQLHHCTVYATFRQLLEKCGIPHHKHTGPRIHDLRHTFAVHRLLDWYQNEQDINAMLPALATYMGHVCVASTHVYLHPTTELLGQVNKRFHNHYLRHFEDKGGKS